MPGTFEFLRRDRETLLPVFDLDSTDSVAESDIATSNRIRQKPLSNKKSAAEKRLIWPEAKDLYFINSNTWQDLMEFCQVLGQQLFDFGELVNGYACLFTAILC